MHFITLLDPVTDRAFFLCYVVRRGWDRKERADEWCAPIVCPLFSVPFFSYHIAQEEITNSLELVPFISIFNCYWYCYQVMVVQRFSCSRRFDCVPAKFVQFALLTRIGVNLPYRWASDFYLRTWKLKGSLFCPKYALFKLGIARLRKKKKKKNIVLDCGTLLQECSGRFRTWKDDWNYARAHTVDTAE